MNRELIEYLGLIEVWVNWKEIVSMIIKLWYVIMDVKYNLLFN